MVRRRTLFHYHHIIVVVVKQGNITSHWLHYSLYSLIILLFIWKHVVAAIELSSILRMYFSLALKVGMPIPLTRIVQLIFFTHIRSVGTTWICCRFSTIMVIAPPHFLAAGAERSFLKEFGPVLPGLMANWLLRFTLAIPSLFLCCGIGTGFSLPVNTLLSVQYGLTVRNIGQYLCRICSFFAFIYNNERMMDTSISHSAVCPLPALYFSYLCLIIAY